MKVQICFSEIKEYVASHFNQNIDLEYSGNKEITVIYMKRISIKDMRIKVKLTVEKVNKDSVSFSLDGGMGLNLIITGVLHFIKDYFVEMTEGITNKGNQITINLSKIKQAEKFVKNVALQDMEFTPSDIILTTSLK